MNRIGSCLVMSCFIAGWGFAPVVVGWQPAPRSSEDVPHLEVTDVTAEHRAKFVAYIKENHEPAVDFVVGQFETCDVVLLGEGHTIAENCRFVASLLEPLYKEGVRTLFWEFTRSSFNKDVQRLVTAAEFDDELAHRLLRDGPWVTWGYKEYVDILRAAWRLNSALPRDAPRFRVIAMDSEWSQFDLWFGGKSQLERFKTIAAREKHMTHVVRSESLEKNEKAIVHIGYAHTLTNSGERLGTVLTKEFGERITQVALHTDWVRPNGDTPLGDLLDQLFADAGGEPIGVKLAGSPLGRLRDSSAGAFRFNKTSAIGDLTRNYVFLRKRDQLHRVTWIDGFTTQERFEQARAIARRMQWISADEGDSPQSLDAAMRRKFNGQRLK